MLPPVLRETDPPKARGVTVARLLLLAQFSLCAKKIGQNVAALFGQHTTGHARRVIEPAIFQELIQRGDRARLRITWVDDEER